jgi:hypothetical protein
MTAAHDVWQRAEMSAGLATPDTCVAVIYTAGHCRVCGCTDDTACDLGAGFVCWWVDEAHTLCSAPKCLAVVPIAELEQAAGIAAAGA